MKKIYGLFIAVLLTIPFLSNAQLELPIPSPKGMVMQNFGLTQITIEFHSPGVNERTIFGGLVPYNEIWRTGANKATSVEFSKDVKVEGKELKAGKYALFTIPGKTEWTLIFSSNTEQWGTGNYKEDEDALRIKVKPASIDFRERMTFVISDFNYDKARVDLEWANTRVSFNVESETEKQSLTNIENTLGSLSNNYAGAARWTLRVEKHYDKGLEWINQALALDNENWYYHWIKAELLHVKGENKEAYKELEQAKKMGENSKNFFYKEDVEKSLKEWPKK